MSNFQSCCGINGNVERGLKYGTRCLLNQYKKGNQVWPLYLFWLYQGDWNANDKKLGSTTMSQKENWTEIIMNLKIESVKVLQFKHEHLKM